jgi:hypothetical protein
MTLQDLKYSFILYTLIKNDYVKEKTAKELGISIRGLRDTLKQMQSKGYKVSKDNPPVIEKNNDDGLDLSVSTHIMPSNEERIAYRDWLANANYMNSMTKRVLSS